MIISRTAFAEGGEVPANAKLAQVKAKLLFAGKDPVAADALATAAMGFNPSADYPNEPFFHAINHLNLAAKMGLGTNQLKDINIVELPIEEVMRKFKVY